MRKLLKNQQCSPPSRRPKPKQSKSKLDTDDPGGIIMLNQKLFLNNRLIPLTLAFLLLTGPFAALPLPALAANSVPYLGESGVPEVCPAITGVLTADARGPAPLGATGATTWYLLGGIFANTGPFVVTGDVRLILEDGCDVTVNGGIDVPPGAGLTLYAQSADAGAGRLTAVASIDNAGIDNAGIGGFGTDAGAITIHGGTVTATGGCSRGIGASGGGAGIGGGTGGTGGPITLT
ncbi:MAG: hypothetical protein FWF86_09180, partial [Clostridia bacterium]|nr:hypothetical protein [Clostridia bacterium]